MKTQIARQRFDDDSEPIEGWSAENQPSYPHLVLVLEELAKRDNKDIAELGADHNDEESDALSIVLADHLYFTEGNGNLRDMGAWVSVDLQAGHYFGAGLDGEEWSVPFCNPEAVTMVIMRLLQQSN